MAVISILLANGHTMFRECLVSRLNIEEDMKVLVQTGNATDLPALVRDLAPQVVLLDPQMPGSPLLAARDICRRFPDTHLVIFGDSFSDSLIALVADVRASGFILKDQGLEELFEALRVVVAGGVCFAPQVLARMVDGDSPGSDGAETRLNRLSPREIEVLRLLAEGQSVKQAARSLGVSYKTVDNQTSSVMRKLDLHSRAELVRYALREQVAVLQ